MRNMPAWYYIMRYVGRGELEGDVELSHYMRAYHRASMALQGTTYHEYIVTGGAAHIHNMYYAPGLRNGAMVQAGRSMLEDGDDHEEEKKEEEY